MSLTKATYSMIQGAPANVLDYGADPTGVADSTTAIQAAIDAATGSVFIPAGTYAVNNVIQVGTTLVYGEGITTKIQSTSASDTFRIGKTAIGAGISTGGGVSNILLEIKDSAGVGIRLLQTQNAYVENVYIACDVARPHTAIGIVLDGGNLSGYFNYIKNVNCVGVDIGFQHTSSGSGFLTSNTFVDCSALCYTNNTNSYGHQFVGNNGLDSIFVGGNLESCKKGVQMATGTWAAQRTQGTSWFGQRWEANSVCDVDFGNGGFRNSFWGYGNFGSSSVPGAVGSLNFDPIYENTFSGTAKGTWTPTFVSSGATFTYSKQIGQYIFDGQRVTVQCTISASASGTVTNPISISGLPFFSNSTTSFIQSGSVSYAQRGTNNMGVQISPNSKSLTLIDGIKNAATPTTLGINGADGELNLSITYLV